MAQKEMLVKLFVEIKATTFEVVGLQAHHYFTLQFFVLYGQGEI